MRLPEVVRLLLAAPPQNCGKPPIPGRWGRILPLLPDQVMLSWISIDDIDRAQLSVLNVGGRGVLLSRMPRPSWKINRNHTLGDPLEQRTFNPDILHAPSC